MKRIALLTLFFFACSFSYPMQARANAAVLLVGAAAIGAAMVATSAGTYYAQTGQMPSYIKTAANAVGSAADEVFQPSYLAKGVGLLFTPQSLNTAKEYYAAKAAAVGAKIGDIVDHVKNSADGMYSALKSLISSSTTPGGTPAGTSISTGNSFLAPNGKVMEFVNDWTYYSFNSISSFTNYITSQPALSGAGGFVYGDSTDTSTYWVLNQNSTDWLYFKATPPTQVVNGETRYQIYYRKAKVSADATPDIQLAPPLVNYPGLAVPLANPSSDVANELRNAIGALPNAQKKVTDSMPATAGQVATAPTLTAGDIAQLLAQNAAAVAQATAQTAKDLAAANPTDVAAQIAANQAAADAAKAAAEAAQNAAQQEAAKEETPPETFSGINDSPFETAYNPGEFDIPARLTSFMGNVKSSGLFSFSSSFFNSLPGGGSPLFVINGGETFGTHTIDLSETFSGGLAAIKAVMLALFGFLSIRAIIMKR